jgi:hypothetical protein
VFTIGQFTLNGWWIRRIQAIKGSHKSPAARRLFECVAPGVQTIRPLYGQAGDS